MSNATDAAWLTNDKKLAEYVRNKSVRLHSCSSSRYRKSSAADVVFALSYKNDTKHNFLCKLVLKTDE